MTTSMNAEVVAEVRFIIVNFEFTMIDQSDILLVSGAISNSLQKYKPVKLEGNPLILTKDDKLRRFRRCDLDSVVQTVKRIFWNEPELMTPLLEQLYRSVNFRGISNLSTSYLQQYLIINNKEPVLIFWNGTTDIKIIKGLRLRGIIKFLDMTACNFKGNNEFFIQLVDLESKKVLYSCYIGTVNTNSRMLSLTETHRLLCNEDHCIPHCHDPMSNVILTKCVFNYVVSKIRPVNLYRLCKETQKQMYKNFVYA